LAAVYWRILALIVLVTGYGLPNEDC
jgi:hypothetical protein